MRSLNKVMLIGHVGQDPESRTTTGGNHVVNFSMATSRQWNNEAGQKQEKTEWHRCVAWAGLADIISNYVRKGSRVYVEGSIEYRQWEDKDGNTRYSTEINVREVLLLDSKKSGNSASSPKGPAHDDDDATDFPYGSNAEDPTEDMDDAPKARGKKRTAGKR